MKFKIKITSRKSERNIYTKSAYYDFTATYCGYSHNKGHNTTVSAPLCKFTAHVEYNGTIRLRCAVHRYGYSAPSSLCSVDRYTHSGYGFKGLYNRAMCQLNLNII